MRIRYLLIVFFALATAPAWSQLPLSQRMAAMAMQKWKDLLVTASSKDGRARWNYQDPQTGVWRQITDSLHAPGNYQESSASCMFVYALARGVRLGYLPASYLQTAKKGYEGVQKEFLEQGARGHGSQMDLPQRRRRQQSLPRRKLPVLLERTHC